MAVSRKRARELAFRVLFQAESGETPVLEVWQEALNEAQSPADAMLEEEQEHELEENEVPMPREEDDEDADNSEPLDNDNIRFAKDLVRAYAEHRDHINSTLEQTIKGWSFSQMAQTDVAILRLAMTELLYSPAIPAQVTIEIAVRIAKKFGSEDSGKFVNGVLAGYYREHKSTLDQKIT